MVDAAYADAVALLTDHRDELDAFAEALVAREQVDRGEIEDLLRSVQGGGRRLPTRADALPTSREPVVVDGAGAGAAGPGGPGPARPRAGRRRRRASAPAGRWRAPPPPDPRGPRPPRAARPHRDRGGRRVGLRRRPPPPGPPTPQARRRDRLARRSPAARSRPLRTGPGRRRSGGSGWSRARVRSATRPTPSLKDPGPVGLPSCAWPAAHAALLPSADPCTWPAAHRAFSALTSPCTWGGGHRPPSANPCIWPTARRAFSAVIAPCSRLWARRGIGASESATWRMGALSGRGAGTIAQCSS